ncbi:MAG: nucleotidyltransferase domain-containing protein, partial [Pleurocapsa sp. SU_196_0]|nr:nucleotidyltransferase domain-containing protein [Pleurocapsa sp. SU_196_0]
MGTSVVRSRKGIGFDDAVKRIVEALEPERIILFGSRARGDHRVDSDYDLLIELRSLHGSRFELAAKAHEAAQERNFPLDVVVASCEEIETSRLEQADFVCHALEDGLVIYEKSARQWLERA